MGLEGVKEAFRSSGGKVFLEYPLLQILYMIACVVSGFRLLLKGLLISTACTFLPKGHLMTLNVAVEELSEIINSREENALIIVCVDFNGDVGHLGGLRSNRKPTKQGCIVNKFFKEFSLCPINLDPAATGPVTTFKGGMGISTIDYIAIPEGLKRHLISCEVLKDDILNASDPYPVKISLNLQCLPRMVKSCPSSSRIKWNNPNVVARFKELSGYNLGILYDICLSEPNNTGEIDINIDYLVSSLVECGKKLPHSRYRKNVKPFWNNQLTYLKR